MTPAALPLLAALLASAGDPAARFAEANRLYLAGDYEGAARAYEALLADGLESPALHVNLGSARFRAGRRGAAIASFERALRLDPFDADARADRAAARAGDADRLGAPERSFLARVAERTPDGWAAAAFSVPWAALFLALGLRRRAARTRPILDAAAALALALSTGGAGLLLARAAERRAAVAIVVAPQAAVREGPEEALRPAFRVREGAAVRLLETRGEAERVRLANGLEGWMSAGELERL